MNHHPRDFAPLSLDQLSPAPDDPFNPRPLHPWEIFAQRVLRFAGIFGLVAALAGLGALNVLTRTGTIVVNVLQLRF